MAKTQESCSVVVESVQDPGNYLLLVETAMHKTHLLNIPGGSVDRKDRRRSGPAFLVCGMRELFEEAHLTIEPTTLVADYRDPKKPNSRHFVIGGQVTEGDIRLTEEHPYMDFFPLEQIERFAELDLLRGPRVADAIRRYHAGEGIPLENFLSVYSEMPKEYDNRLSRAAA